MRLTLETLHHRCCEQDGDCLLWRQGTTGQGYPCALINGRRSVNVRRWVLEQTGVDLRGRRVMTLCQRKLCLNPEHLRAMTRAASQQWLVRTGVMSTPAVCATRTATARARAATKLSMEAARSMRAMRADGASIGIIAAKFDVSPDTAWKVVTNKSWRECAPNASAFSRRA